MLGTELREWRKRNRMTQDMLRMDLDLGSRQTIITWEKSDQPLPRIVELALLALEHLPQFRGVDGYRFGSSEVNAIRERVFG
jgi:DNA-binding XRE family transcriptional regulator